MMRPFAAVALLIAAVALAPLPGGAARIDDKIKAEQRKLETVKAQLKVKRSELENATAKVDSIAEQLALTARNIAAVQAHLAEIDAGMEFTRRKLNVNRVQLAAAQASLQRHNEALKRRLIDAYEVGDLGYLAVMLQAKSFGDFIDRWNDIRFVILANQATVRARRADAERVAAIRTSLLADESALSDALTSAQQQRRALDGLAVQRRNLLAVAQSERSHVRTEVAQLDDMSEEAEAALENLIRQKQQEEDERRAAIRRAAQLAGESLPPEPGAPGQLIWPVSGPITSPFGMRMHPVYGRPIVHRGIDIAAAQGTTVAAAADGRVIVASYQGDCGNMIAIDHRGGLSTMYCHLSAMFVGVGQDVQRGQAIGAVGMTGDATGPHLHFQVMQDAKPVDPMSFLR